MTIWLSQIYIVTLRKRRIKNERGGEIVLIKINELECKGCEVCLDVCPKGAIYLCDDVAGVDLERCDECRKCIAECPSNAISWVDEKSEIIIPQIRMEQVRANPSQVGSSAALKKRTSILPTAIAAIALIGMEIVPRVLDILAERQFNISQSRGSSVSSPRTNQASGRRNTYGQFRFKHRGRSL